MRAVLFVAALAFGLAPGCSADHPPAASSSSSGSGTIVDGGTPDALVATDGAVPPRPELCQGLVLGGKVAEELSQAGPPTIALGGTLVLGTYALEELDVYGSFDAGAPDGGDGTPGVQATGRTVSSTLVVTKDTLQIVEAFGTTSGSMGAPTPRAYAYVAKEKSLNAAQQCPTTAATKPIGFTASGDALALFPDPNHRYVYRLKP